MELSRQASWLVFTSGKTEAFISATSNGLPVYNVALPYSPSSTLIRPVLQGRFVAACQPRRAHLCDPSTKRFARTFTLLKNSYSRRATPLCVIATHFLLKRQRMSHPSIFGRPAVLLELICHFTSTVTTQYTKPSPGSSVVPILCVFRSITRIEKPRSVVVPCLSPGCRAPPRRGGKARY